MKRPWHYLTPADWLVLLILILIGVGGLVWTSSAVEGRRVVVTDGAQILYMADLNQAAEVDLRGPLGTTHLVIDGSGARITQAPCPLKTCLRMGPARYVGDLLACVPNRILVQIEGDTQEKVPYDLLSR